MHLMCILEAKKSYFNRIFDTYKSEIKRPGWLLMTRLEEIEIELNVIWNLLFITMVLF